MPDWSGPGLILNFLKLRGSSEISQHALENWIDQEYVPALLATGGLSGAWLYKAANPAYDKQHILVCKVSDLALIRAEELGSVGKDSKGPQLDGSVDEQVELDLRIYSFVQQYETSKHDEGESRGSPT